MRDPHVKYEHGSEDQDSVMKLIDSQAWPSESQVKEQLTIYEKIHKCVEEIRDIHWKLNDADIKGKNRKQLTAEMNAKEKDLDAYIVELRDEGKFLSQEQELPY